MTYNLRLPRIKAECDCIIFKSYLSEQMCLNFEFDEDLNNHIQQIENELQNSSYQCPITFLISFK